MTDRGFTLAEVLVALVVFSISAIGLAHLVTETTANAGHTRSLSLARIEADNRLVAQGRLHFGRERPAWAGIRLGARD